MLKSRYWIRALGLVLLAALAAGGGLTRRYREERCALDGQRIQPIFRVRIARRGEPPHSFCCIRCAEIWRARGGGGGVISVTDEVTGRELDAELAHYVRSSTPTIASTGNRIHVFQELTYAERYASQSGGLVLAGPERPFGTDPGATERD